MTLRSLRWGIALAPALFAGVLLAAASSSSCSNGGGTHDAGGTDAGSDAEVLGPCQNGTIQLLECEPPGDGAAPEDRFTDEACESLDDAESRGLVHDDANAPSIDAPTEAQVLPSATPFVFAWHPTGLSLGPRSYPLRAPRAYTVRDELSRWAELIPAAEAHCTPFGGVAYAVVFKNTAGAEVLRFETANHDYTPTAEAWAALRAAGGTLSMTVEAARFSENVVTEGPYDQTAPRHFSIGP